MSPSADVSDTRTWNAILFLFYKILQIVYKLTSPASCFLPFNSICTYSKARRYTISNFSCKAQPLSQHKQAQHHNHKTSCQRLSTVQGLAPEKLIKLAFKFLPFRTLQAVFATLHPAQHRILMQQQRRGVSLHHLANTLYYHQGATLSRMSRWNEMMKLQMQLNSSNENNLMNERKSA